MAMKADFKIEGELVSLEYEEILSLTEKMKSYTLKEKDLFRIDEILTRLKTKTNLDELIRNPQKPDWCINDILITRIKWASTGESYKRVEHRELIIRNLKNSVIVFENILKIILDKNKNKAENVFQKKIV